MKPNFFINREHENRLIVGRTDHPHSSLHFHSHIEVYLVTSGEVEVWINDRRAVLGAGECAVALPYDTHGYRAHKKASALYLIIPADLCPPFTAAVQGKSPKEAFLKDEALFQKLTACFEALEQTEEPLSRQGYVFVLLGTLLQKLRLEKESRTVEPPLSARLLSFIAEHLDGDLSLSSVAAALGYNAGYLSSYFKNSMHIGLPDYVNLLRLRQAVLMMKDPRHSIAECAYGSGFASLRTFYRVFEREFHCTPTEYRKNNRNKNS